MSATRPSAELEGVAIIGMSGRFPGARSVEAFWQNLVRGVETISRFRPEELEYSVATPEGRARGQQFVPARGVLEDVDQFDAAFFGIQPREAALMDPQHRLFLECAWEALEAAGYDSEAFGGLIGVYAGLSINSYLLWHLCGDRAFLRDYAGNYQVGHYPTMLGNERDFLPTRVSYKLNLRGPSLTVQSACSTSLVAVCQACTSLLTYQCDMALAGGVSITFPQKRDYLYEEGGMVSPDGTCRAFDAGARGTVFGHGVAVVLLKRLADAVEAGDHVLAVIKGTAVNNDGAAKVGYAAPSVTAQAEVIALAQAAAGVDPETVSYVEAHGTGTPLGDPIEVAALTQAFRQGGARRSGYCALGSAKTYVGHLDIAAGATGLIKTVLQLQHEQIPPLLHFQAPNPQIDFANSPFFPVAKLLDWKRGDTPRRAGVSAFGVGGTNAHVVVEEAPPPAETSPSRPRQLLVLSAKTETALAAMTDNLARHLEAHPDLALPDVAFTLHKGRRAFAHRRALVAKDLPEAVAALKTADARSLCTGKAPAQQPEVIFLFPGQGAQHVDMARQLYEGEPVFRGEVDRCAEFLQGQLGRDIRAILYPDTEQRGEAERQINETGLTQPAIFVVEYALARLWMSWGVKPAVVLGHSIGEYVCAVLAGTFTLEDGLALLATRARLMQALPGGAMLAVRRSADEIEARLPAGASLAAVNSANACTASGPSDVLLAFQKELEAEKIATRLLATSHAFHSAMMEPMLPEFTRAAQCTPAQPPKLRWVSSCTGKWMLPEDLADGTYWARQLRHTVRFADALQTALGVAGGVFLEVGPGQTLGQLVRQHPAKPAALTVLNSLSGTSDPEHDLAAVLNALGRLWVAGVKPDWDAFYAAEKRRRVPLPTYPFERKRFWVEPAPLAPSAEVGPAPSPANALPAGVALAASSPGPASLPPAAVVAPAPLGAGTAPVGAAPAPANRRERLDARLRTLFGELSGADQSQMDPNASFVELGFDSLFLTQASQAILSQFRVKVTFRQLMGDQSTLTSLVAYLEERLPADVLPAEAAAPVSAAAAPVPAAGGAALPTAVSAPTGAALPVPPVPLPGQPAGAGGTLVEQVIQQQMAIMAQQLELLRGLGASASAGVPTAAPAGAPGAPAAPPPPKVVALPGQKEDTARFGPFKGIEKGPSGGLTARQQRALAALIARYNRRTAASKRYAQQHRAHFCDPRAAGNFRQLWKEMVYPIVCARSKGGKIWDIDGNEYVDVTLGFGANYFGHAPDFVVQALEEQLRKGFEIGPQCPLAGEAAELFCELTGMERATFCNTGSEAVMAALRVARTVTGRLKVVYFAGDYHGVFDEVLGRPALVNGQPGALPIAPGIPPLPHMMVLPYDDPNSLEIIAAQADQIAAVLVEPVQSRHPGLQPRAFLHELRRLTQQKDIALIFDEVVTGFRAAPGGAQEYFGVKADLGTYGKVVGGGMPIGVLAGSARYMDALDGGFWQFGDDSSPPTGVTFFAGTFVRHPLAMAAAHATLRYLKQAGPALQRDTTAKTARLVERLNGFFSEAGVPIRLQTFTTIFYYDFHPDLKYAGLLFYALRDRGVHIWEGRVGHVCTAHTEAELDHVVRAFRESVAELQEGGFLPAGGEVPAAEPPPERGLSAPAARSVDLQPVAAPASAGAVEGEPSVPASRPVVETAGTVRLDAGQAGAQPETAAVLAQAGEETSNRIPLTEGQTEMWLAAQFAPEAAGPQHGSNVIHLEGDLDVTALQRALTEAVNRHEALRSTFAEDGRELLVAPAVAVELPVDDLSGLPADARPAAVERVLAEEGRRLLNLTRGPLFAFRLIRLSAREHLLVFTVQMIICDGWSYTLVLEDIAALYSALVEKRTAVLAAPTPMREYVRWQRSPAGAAAARDAEAFWRQQFQTLPPPLELPGFKPRPATRSFAGDRQTLRLSAEFYQQLKQAARRLKSTPFAVLLAAYQTWLYRLSGTEDLVVGVPFAGQSGAGLETLVGQCVHTLPVRCKLEAGEPFAGLLRRTREALCDAQEHWHVSLGRLVQALDLPRDPSRMPLVSVIFNLDVPLNKAQFAGCRQRVSATPRFYFQYDLGFNLVDEGETLLIECDYSSSLFDAETIRAWLGHYQTLLAGIVADAEQPLNRLPLLHEAERHRRLVEWNATAQEWSGPGTVHALVAAQVERTPEATAVEWAGQKLSYAELDARANQVAHLLRSLGVGSETLVGVCVDRSFALPVALLGVLKAGGAYVPLDADAPPARLAQVLEDTGAPVLLTLGRLLSRLPTTKARLICLDEDRDVIAQQSRAAVPDTARPEHLTYVIYTSGSTGRPKGVEITHAAVVNFLQSMRRAPGLTAADAVLALTTVTFDIAVLELFLPLTVGARTVLVSREVLTDPAELSRILERCGVTVMQATPATWRLLLNAGWKGNSRLRVLCGGEALSPDLAERLLASCGELWNLYGPTETTVWSTGTRVRPGEPITLGAPIANTQVVVVDELLQPLPVGVPGELVIGGRGLARGYRNLPALTAEKFIPDPFRSGGRLYRTGDLARYRGDGRIEFLGRRDFQVKLRGHRLELGEIEYVLLTHPQVREAAVLVREDDPTQPRLVAYVAVADGLAAGNAAALRAELRQWLRRKLPDYMLPSAIVTLESLPQTPEGKTDRLALPPPAAESFQTSDQFVAPRDPTEETLAKIWASVLKLERVSVRDSFFDLGGQSLLAVALFARLEKEFGRKLPLATLFRAPTIEQLARALRSGDEALAQWSSLVAIQPRGTHPPLFLVHGAGGNVLLYRCLAQHLAPDYPLYGLQSRGLDGKSPPLTTIEQMAEEYLREVRAVQPHGPYYLGGYCLGGTVAYEMAQRLCQQGEEVALVAMLDTYNFIRALKASFAGFLFEKARFHLGNLLRLRPKEMMQYLAEKVRIARDGELANLATSRPGSSGQVGVARAESGVEASVQAVNDYAADHYVPKPYPGRLTLFKPHVNYKFYPDPNMGWGDLALGGLDIVELPVNPHAMLVEPYVRLLADALKTRLGRAPAAQPVAPVADQPAPRSPVTSLTA